MPLSRIITIFLAVFIVVDPFGIVPVYISLTGGFAPARRRRTILKASVVAFLVLCLFTFTGSAILGFLGIQPGSFYIAGGILMFIVSIDLLLGKPGRTKTSGNESEEDRDDVSIFPLAIPMLAGPGAITTILLYASEENAKGIILPGARRVLGARPGMRRAYDACELVFPPGPRQDRPLRDRAHHGYRADGTVGAVRLRRDAEARHPRRAVNRMNPRGSREPASQVAAATGPPRAEYRARSA